MCRYGLLFPMKSLRCKHLRKTLLHVPILIGLEMRLLLAPGGVPVHRGSCLHRGVLHLRDAQAGQAAQLRAGDLHDGEDGSRQAHRRLQLHGHLGLQREVRRALGLHR